MRIAIVGAGINGIMSAWALARRGHTVDLYERGQPVAGTSSASTKLLHGGLRYLETGDIALVREGLRERAWWLAQAPHLAQPLELLLPVQRGQGRPRWKLKAGLTLYDTLAGCNRLAPHRWLEPQELLARMPGLRAHGLLGAYAYWDGQMDDHQLGLWALAQAQAAGVRLHAGSAVERVDLRGHIQLAGSPAPLAYDLVCNLAGPHAAALLARSGVPSRHRLRLVRGSHLLIDGTLPCGLLVQSPDDQRACFILPYGGRILIGTTEVEQTLDAPVRMSDAERDYLLAVWNAHFDRQLTPDDVRASFAGLRPLLAQSGAANANTREHAIEARGRLLTVFGGKWTTARRLGEQVAEVAEQLNFRPCASP